MSLQTFIERARAKKNKNIKAVTLEVEDFGQVDFIRPKQEIILQYMEIAEGDRENISIKQVAEESKKFLYMCSPDLQSKELRDEYPELTPTDIPGELFGISQTMVLASQLFEKFEGSEVLAEIEEEVKNSSEVVENKESSTGSPTTSKRDLN